MNSFKTIGIITTLALTLSACGNKQAQVKKYYRLGGVDIEAVTKDKKDMTLVVKRPSALSILGGRPMVATKEDGSLVQLSHNFWIESPKVLLQDKLKDWAKNHWQHVKAQTPSEGEYHTLNTRILAFEKQQNKALVSLEFTAFDQDDKQIYNKRFDQTQVIDGEGFKSFVSALNKALDATLTQLAQEL